MLRHVAQLLELLEGTNRHNLLDNIDHVIIAIARQECPALAAIFQYLESVPVIDCDGEIHEGNRQNNFLRHQLHASDFDGKDACGISLQGGFRNNFQNRHGSGSVLTFSNEQMKCVVLVGILEQRSLVPPGTAHECLDHLPPPLGSDRRKQRSLVEFIQDHVAVEFRIHSRGIRVPRRGHGCGGHVVVHEVFHLDLVAKACPVGILELPLGLVQKQKDHVHTDPAVQALGSHVQRQIPVVVGNGHGFGKELQHGLERRQGLRILLLAVMLAVVIGKGRNRKMEGEHPVFVSYGSPALEFFTQHLDHLDVAGRCRQVEGNVAVLVKLVDGGGKLLHELLAETNGGRGGTLSKKGELVQQELVGRQLLHFGEPGIRIDQKQDLAPFSLLDGIDGLLQAFLQNVGGHHQAHQRRIHVPGSAGIALRSVGVNDGFVLEFVTKNGRVLEEPSMRPLVLLVRQFGRGQRGLGSNRTDVFVLGERWFLFVLRGCRCGCVARPGGFHSGILDHQPDLIRQRVKRGCLRYNVRVLRRQRGPVLAVRAKRIVAVGRRRMDELDGRQIGVLVLAVLVLRLERVGLLQCAERVVLLVVKLGSRFVIAIAIADFRDAPDFVQQSAHCSRDMRSSQAHHEFGRQKRPALVGLVLGNRVEVGGEGAEAGSSPVPQPREIGGTRCVRRHRVGIHGSLRFDRGDRFDGTAGRLPNV
mmetsp:Transcript_1503/g.3893  ORF Transcript_1503/g.3893 Transcript_1503/m.3893 type:complete len:699 (+) Transcript_1503:1278-3374(+)